MKAVPAAVRSMDGYLQVLQSNGLLHRQCSYWKAKLIMIVQLLP